jgi:hypothetical protein
MTTDPNLTPRAFGLTARLFVSLLVAATASALLSPSRASAIVVDGVDLQVKNLKYIEELKPSEDSCDGDFCRHSSDETRTAAVLYSIYNQGDEHSWGMIIHLRIDGQPYKTTHVHGGGLGSDDWIHNHFEIPPLASGPHDLEILIQAVRDPGRFARIPVDVNPSNDRKSIHIVVHPTL